MKEEELEQKMREWSKLLENQPRYPIEFRASYMTRQYLMIYFGRREFHPIDNISLIYKGLEVKSDDRLKIGSLRVVFNDKTIQDIEIPAPMYMRNWFNPPYNKMQSFIIN